MSKHFVEVWREGGFAHGAQSKLLNNNSKYNPFPEKLKKKLFIGFVFSKK